MSIKQFSSDKAADGYVNIDRNYNMELKMFRLRLFAILLMLPVAAIAGERVSATNYYVVKQENFNAGNEVYWKEDNVGTYTVNEGPINPGFARCVGAGFGSSSGVRGGGICIYGEDADTFTMKWKTEEFGINSWHIVSGTGKYSGMTGKGTTKTRVQSKFLKIPHRVSDWEGVVELPGKKK